MNAIRLQRKALGYKGKTVLREIDLTIRNDDRVALLGPSGAGKTTLLEALYQTVPSLTALCPQQPSLVPALSVYNNIYSGKLEQRRWWQNLLNLLHPHAPSLRQAQQLCELVGLQGLLRDSVDRLSGGQQQRVTLARALIQQKPVFMGDEPVSSLDPVQGEALLQHMASSHSIIIVALHQRRLALSCCNRIIGLRDGAIVLNAPARTLSTQDLDTLYQGHSE